MDLQEQSKLLTQHITTKLQAQSRKVKYGHSHIYVLAMPTESCAHTGMEILSGEVGNVQVYHTLGADGHEDLSNPKLTTYSAIRNKWDGEVLTLDSGLESIGLYLGGENEKEERRQEKMPSRYVVKSDSRSLRKYLDQRLNNGQKIGMFY